MRNEDVNGIAGTGPPQMSALGEKVLFADPIQKGNCFALEVVHPAVSW